MSDTITTMPRKSPAKKRPKLSDTDRHKRFVATAREIGASEKPKDFDKAFKKVTRAPKLSDGA